MRTTGADGADADAEPIDDIAPRRDPPPTPPAVRWLLLLALLYTIYFAKSLLMPLVVALLFALLLSPLVGLLKRFYIPRPVSAILILSLIGVPLGMLTSQLSEPAQRWIGEIPELTEKLSQQVDDLTDRLAPQPQPVLERPESGGFSFFGLFGGDDAAQETEPEADSSVGEGGQVSEKLKQGGLEAMLAMLSAAPVMIVQLFTTVVLILFLLIFGPRLFVAYVSIFPSIQDKPRTILLVRTIQVELSRYILTVSAINTCLGLSTAAALWFLGVEDALLWGVLVGLLNFAPYFGPLIAVLILSLVGLVQYGQVAFALVPALVYFTINLVEAQFVTPMTLGRHMRLNPLAILLWLVIWGWLWGAVGVLLAVPLLVCLKLVAGQTGVMNNWVQLIETRA